jgi:hypothetical protein
MGWLSKGAGLLVCELSVPRLKMEKWSVLLSP